MMKNLRIKIKKFSEIIDKIDEALYPIIGLPSYEKYLEHFKKNHPGEKPMSKAEFFKEAQDKKGDNVKC